MSSGGARFDFKIVARKRWKQNKTDTRPIKTVGNQQVLDFTTEISVNRLDTYVLETHPPPNTRTIHTETFCSHPLYRKIQIRSEYQTSLVQSRFFSISHNNLGQPTQQTHQLQTLPTFTSFVFTETFRSHLLYRRNRRILYLQLFFFHLTCGTVSFAFCATIRVFTTIRKNFVAN